MAVQNGSVFVPVLTLGQTTGTLNVTGLSFSNVDCTVDATERVCTANLETQFTKTGSGNLGGNTKIFESFIAFRLTGTTGMGTITGCEVGAAGGGGPVGGDGGGTDGGGDAGDPGDFLECAALPNGYYHNNICHNKIPVYKADPPVTAAPGTFWVRDPAGMDPPPH